MNTKSLNLLNRALADELSAMHQYLYFYIRCDDQNRAALTSFFKNKAINKIGRLEKLANRILFLKGDLEMETAQVEKPNTVNEMLTAAREIESQRLKDYDQLAKESADNADTVSRQLFENLAAEDEKFFNNLVKLGRIEKFGSNYLAVQSMDSNKC